MPLKGFGFCVFFPICVCLSVLFYAPSDSEAEKVA